MRESGSRPVLTAQGKARKRMFQADLPDGKGHALRGVLKDGGGDPAGVRAWALLQYVFFAESGTERLRNLLGERMASGKSGGVPSWMSAPKALGLEQAWLDWLERA